MYHLSSTLGVVLEDNRQRYVMRLMELKMVVFSNSVSRKMNILPFSNAIYIYIYIYIYYVAKIDVVLLMQ